MNLLAAKFKSKIPAISLIISIIVAWLMFPPVTGFPMVAFFIFFIGLSSLVLLVRKEKTWFDVTLYAGVLLLSFFIIYRADGIVQFLDFLFIIFFGSLLIRPLIHEQGVFTLLLSPFFVIHNMFKVKNIFPYTFKVRTKYIEESYIREYLPTIGVTVLIMLITIPLLASANPFFNALLQNILNFFNLDWLFKYLFADSFGIYIFRGAALAFLAFFIPRLLSLSAEGMKPSTLKSLFSINYLIPKVAMAGLLIVFFVTQLQLYFASSQTLLSMGYSNSRLTNEVFAQVTIVAFIVFLLAYLDKSKKVWNTRLTYFLIIEAFFLVGIAFKSVNDYTSLYGFTHKRLWGYTTMAWLSGALAAFVYHYRKHTPNTKFIKQVLSYTVALLLLVNVLNFDYLIYHYYKPSTQDGTDYLYISSLSPDAHYYKEVLAKSMSEAEKSHFLDSTTTNSVYMILGSIDFLTNKYGTRKDINTFNIAEYQEYLAIKDIDTLAYREKIRKTQEKYTPQQ